MLSDCWQSRFEQRKERLEDVSPTKVECFSYLYGRVFYANTKPAGRGQFLGYEVTVMMACDQHWHKTITAYNLHSFPAQAVIEESFGSRDS